jgi:3-hydroxyisobutyrate dehydrogenase-like beta-hydroxyacid dehydrogenase
VTTIAVLGLGEAGSIIARDAAAAGAGVRGFDPARPAPVGVEGAADAVAAVTGADVVLSVNSAMVASTWQRRWRRCSARAGCSRT